MLTALWTFKYRNARDEVSKLAFRRIPYDETVEVQEVDAASILKYPLQMTDDLFTGHSFKETEADRNADPVVRRM